MKFEPAGLVVGILMAFTPVLAADSLPPSLEACSRMSRDAERLLCYDKAVAFLKEGLTGATTATPENMFGANSDVLAAPANNGPVKREELKQISGSVTSLHRGDDGMIQIELDNGQVWRQQDADVHLMVSKGDTVTIVRAVMGTFRLTDKSGRFARFKRVR